MTLRTRGLLVSPHKHGDIYRKDLCRAPQKLVALLLSPLSDYIYPTRHNSELDVFFFLNKFIYLFIYFCLLWVFIAARGLSLVVASGDYSSLRCAGFSLQWLLLLRSTGARRTGCSSCGSWTLERRLSSCGLVAPRHVGSSWTRAQTRVPCIGRRILNDCATREAPRRLF